MIKNILNWIKLHSITVITALLVITMMRGCKSRSIERRLEYTSTKYEYTIDSLNKELEIYKHSTDTCVRNLYDTIHSLRSENTILKSVIKDIQRDKEHYRRVNNDVINIIIIHTFKRLFKISEILFKFISIISVISSYIS